MIVLEVDDVEVDHCVACRGTWLDSGELELLLDGAQNKDSLLANIDREAKTSESPVNCPICDKHMQKVTIGTDPVVLDKCKRNHGIWFDKGELRGVIARGDFQGDPRRVHDLLVEIFGDVN